MHLEGQRSEGIKIAHIQPIISIGKLHAMSQHLRRISTADHHRYNASIGTPWHNTITHPPGHPPPHLINRISAVPPTLLPPKLQGIYRPIRPPLQRPFIVPFSPEMESKWLNEFRAKHLRYSEERLGQHAPRLESVFL